MKIIFLSEKSYRIDNKNLNFETFKELKLMPYPNSISIKDGYCLFSSKTNVIVQDINSTHDILKQFEKELEEDFGWNLVWIEKNPSEIDIPPFVSTKSVKDESYSIQVCDKCLILESDSLHGLFNSFQTFRQLLQNSKKVSSNIDIKFSSFIIPYLEIVDWPALKIRGIADDISRGQIPTVTSLKRFIKILSQYKTNYFALYMEDVFKCSRHPEVGKERGAFSPEELIELDKYAQSRFVTLFPILETLGHMDNILTIPEYESLGEFPGAQCFSLGNGNIYPFFRDFIEELSPCFSSKIFHLGGDETFDLGHGASKDIINAVGMGKALFDHYIKLYRIAKENGNKKVILYHDIIAKYPEVLKKFPKDVTLMYWDYLPKKKFKKLSKLNEYGLDIIVSPSMLCWTRHFPDYENSFKNIVNIIEDAKSLNLVGQLNSTWGDFANQNLRENNIYGGIISATSSWTFNKIQYKKTIQDISFLLYGIENTNDQKTFVVNFIALNQLKKYYSRKIAILPQNFYPKLYRHPFKQNINKKEKVDYKSLRKEVVPLINSFINLQLKVTINSHYYDYAIFSCKLCDFWAKKEEIGEKIRDFMKDNCNNSSLNNSSQKKQVISKIIEFRNYSKQIFDDYEKLWFQCAKKPNLEFPLSRFNKIEQFCDQQIEIIENNLPFSSPILRSYYIWDKNKAFDSKTRYFRKTINLPNGINCAKIQVIAGNVAKVFINGIYQGQVNSRGSLSILPLKKAISVFDITGALKLDSNVIAIEANHYLKSIGYINVLLQYEIDNEKTSEKKIAFTEVLSDASWMCTKFTQVDMDWTKADFEENACFWKPAKIIAAPPRINLDLYHPNLIKGENSIPEDLFGIIPNLFLMLDFFIPRFLSKIVRFFSKKILKILY